ncbi:MAG TPA: Uma2 family endonuclease [Fimbriiglobus sp.]|nr:Uma2 family endonuclease [Fimbriiglobus sp.]
MATVERPLLTVEEFMKLPDPPDGSKMELAKGEVVLMPPPKGRHGVICSRIDRRVGNFVDEHKLGWVTANDAGVVLERGPDTVRGPDVAFWSIVRQPTIPDAYFEVPPDLAVEVLSPGDSRKAAQAKIKEYVFYGVRLVWLVDPKARTVTVFAGTIQGKTLDESGTLDGGDVLPGFTCKVAELFG